MLRKKRSSKAVGGSELRIAWLKRKHFRPEEQISNGKHLKKLLILHVLKLRDFIVFLDSLSSAAGHWAKAVNMIWYNGVRLLECINFGNYVDQLWEYLFSKIVNLLESTNLNSWKVVGNLISTSLGCSHLILKYFEFAVS